MQQIKLGSITVDVEKKDIKNIHLSVYPPKGRVKIAAPLHYNIDTIRMFAISKLSWIKKQQEKLRNQQREAQREYKSRESHYFLGKRYLLKVIEQDSAPQVVLKHNVIELHIRKGTSVSKKEEILQIWYRQQLRELTSRLIAKLEKKISMKVSEVCIRRMKTKWGTCNQKAKRIWLNTELAKKPIESIEYVLIHEMVHLRERNHNEKFIAYMNKYAPNWKNLREELNRSALGHVEWCY